MGFALFAGVAICMGACYIFNKMTEAEREYQREIRRAHRRYREGIEKTAQEYKNKAREELLKEYQGAEITQEKELEKAYEINRKEVSEYHDLLKKVLAERKEKKSQELEEIKNNLDELNKIKKSNTTYLRYRSFGIIEIELMEAKNYLEAYLKYLEEYEKRLEREFNHNLEVIGKGKFYKFELEPVEFLLPEDYPYFGKLLEIDSQDIEKNGVFKRKITGLYYPKNYKIVDMDNLEKFIEKGIKIPMVVESFNKESKNWEVRIGKGLLIKNFMEQPGLGIKAIVERVERNIITLDYYGIKLGLKIENLINPRVIPMRGSSLTVYPLEIKKEIRGSYIPKVTEDIRESAILEYISDIPLMVKSEDEKRFKEYFLEKNKEEKLGKNTCLNWKVGIENKEKGILKLQLGESIVILVEKVILENKNQYLRFIDFSNEKFKPQDIFLGINGTFVIRVEKQKPQFTDIELESMNAFLLLSELEFKNQEKIKESVPGTIYYNKWVEITDKLVNHMFKDSEKLICEFSDFQLKKEEKFKKLRTYSATILNFEQIETKLRKIIESGNKEFIIESEVGQYYEVRFFTEIEDNKVEVIEKLNDNYIGTLKEREIVEKEVYVKRFPYAEVQQKLALNSFLTSDIENIKIKLSMLSGKNIEKINDEKRIKIDKFFNKSIENNIYQRKIVEDAINSQDIFYIQGPPGTGKTTVIKEIILQQLKLNQNSNILITSQTNVAVDNVLKGLERYNDEIDKKELLRCGNDDKIAEEIKEYGFDNILEKYKKELKEVELSDNNEKNLKNIWEEYINENNRLKNELGELLLRSKRIIGATCVGIANKRIGLDNMAFDLVIVDEASKALPAEILIPLNKAKKCVIIGDHKQLPPTINKALTDQDEIDLEDREYCENELFEKSLFEKLFEEAPEYAKGILKTQYRMPSSIGKMVSKFFYDGELENGESCSSKTSLFFKENLNWIDTSKLKNNVEDDTMSPFNIVEATVIKDLIKSIRNKGINERVAIITPYKGQKRKIVECLRQEKINENVIVDTIDSFQGDEADIVIFSVTRAKKKTDFFSKDARLNVAFSRAKREFIIVGSIDYFIKKYGIESKLSRIAEFIKENGNIITLNNEDINFDI